LNKSAEQGVQNNAGVHLGERDRIRKDSEIDSNMKRQSWNCQPATKQLPGNREDFTGIARKWQIRRGSGRARKLEWSWEGKFETKVVIGHEDAGWKSSLELHGEDLDCAKLA
jgi:hypothetical protein